MYKYGTVKAIEVTSRRGEGEGGECWRE
jgi:hypothetical protein